MTTKKKLEKKKSKIHVLNKNIAKILFNENGKLNGDPLFL